MTLTSTCRAVGPVVLLCLARALPAGEAASPAGYQHYLIGNPADVVRPTTGLIVLQGGGDDVDENYVRMGARGGGGDFVVLRASGEDDYNDYIYELCHCDSVETIVFHGREAASDPYVIRTIRNAEAIFIAGGDQSRYVRFWKGTPVEDAINFVAAKPAPDRRHERGHGDPGRVFLFRDGRGEPDQQSGARRPVRTRPDARARLSGPAGAARRADRPAPVGARPDWPHRHPARAAAARRLAAEARGIAADRETALHIDPRDGSVEVFATADHPTPYVYFLRTARPPERCEPGQPLTIHDVAVYRLAPGGRFDLASWSGRGGIAYTLSAEDGRLHSSRGGLY